MNSSPHRYIDQLEVFGAIIALAYILTFMVIAGIRLFYPYELEWIEGANIDEMRWIISQGQIYSEPKLSFIPLAYTPVYFVISAFAMKLLGVGFFAPRLISILSASGILFLLYFIVAKETRHHIAGVIAAGLFAAGYRFTGAWLDIAKTDSLFLFFILAAFYVGWRDRRLWRQVLCGILLVLAYFTKQTSLPIILGLAPISLIVSRGRTWAIWLTTGLLGILIFLGLDKFSHGWFSFYTFETIILHDRVPDALTFWRIFLPVMWPTLLVAAFYAATVLRNTKPIKWQWPEKSWHLLGFLIALFLSSWSIYLKVWTYDNDLLPTSMGMALVAGICLGGYHAMYRVPDYQSKTALVVRTGIIALVLIQFIFLLYNPLEQIPSRSDRMASQAIVDRIKSLPGEVLVFQHGFYNYLAGKTTYFHSVPYGDVVGGNKPARDSDTYWRREKTHRLIQGAFQEQFFDWVVVDTPNANWFPNYLYVDQFIDQAGSYFPITGAPSSPQSLMIRNPIAYGGNLPLSDPYLEVLFVSGWDSPQEWGRWGVGDSSVLKVSLENKHKYSMTIEVRPNCTDNKPLATSMQVLWNDDHIDTVGFTSCDRQVIKLNLSRKVIKKEFNYLEFVYENGASDNLTWSPQIGFYSIELAQR
jgi:4-amino-4-deoxy-L-arabinose transferase-like glycosyltransferase